MSVRRAGASSLAAPLLVLAGCAGFRPALPPPATAGEEPEFVRHRTVDPDTGAVLHLWSVRVDPDGRVVKHGREERFHSDGSPSSSATWRDGELVGELRRWHAGGGLRSIAVYDPAGGLAPMAFWHSNGDPAAEGTARRGVREGYWRFWYEGGVLRERGGYVDGRRTGLWTHCWPDGSVQASGRYESDERVGPWRHHEPGERLPDGGGEVPRLPRAEEIGPGPFAGTVSRITGGEGVAPPTP